MNIYEKLQEARLKLQATEMKKTGENKFAGYKYFELRDFLQPAQSIFKELKLFGAVSFTADLATLTIIDCEKPEDKIVFTSPMGSAALKGCHEVQNIGAVETYQRRYLWVTALEIVEHDVLDATTGGDSPKQQSKPAPEPISESKLADLMSALDAAENLDELKELFASAWKESKGHASIKKHYETLKGKFQ